MRRPARDWESKALPLGNGALGAMVFGRVASPSTPSHLSPDDSTL
jgi:hypothetical protein